VAAAKDPQGNAVYTNNALPTGMTTDSGSSLHDGNSMLDPGHFSPHLLMFSATFDIQVYSRGSADISKDAKTQVITAKARPEELLYTLHDVSLTGYSFSFTPGPLLQEVVTFLCIRVQDHQVAGQNPASQHLLKTI